MLYDFHFVKVYYGLECGLSCSVWAWEECVFCCCWMKYLIKLVDGAKYWFSACWICQSLIKECWSFRVQKWLCSFLLAVLSVLHHVFWRCLVRCIHTEGYYVFSEGWLFFHHVIPSFIAYSLPCSALHFVWNWCGYFSFLLVSVSVVYMEKAMAPHSSTLAWKIPWAEEPGRLQSMGSLRVRHDWTTSLSLFTLMHWRRKWQPTPVFLPGESQGWGSLVGCCLWGRTELDTTEVTQQQQRGLSFSISFF